MREDFGAAAYTDLRDSMEQVGCCGELKRFENVDWNLEIAGIADLGYRKAKRGRCQYLDAALSAQHRGVGIYMGDTEVLKLVPPLFSTQS